MSGEDTGAEERSPVGRDGAARSSPSKHRGRRRTAAAEGTRQGGGVALHRGEVGGGPARGTAGAGQWRFGSPGLVAAADGGRGAVLSQIGRAHV